jgi:ribosomal protein S27AE
MQKQCSKCGQVKTLETDFYKNPLLKLGYEHRCKECAIKSSRDSYRRTHNLKETGIKKTCPHCSLSKHVNRFYKRSSSKDGRQSYCIDCTLESNRKRDKKLLTKKPRTYIFTPKQTTKTVYKIFGVPIFSKEGL